METNDKMELIVKILKSIDSLRTYSYTSDCENEEYNNYGYAFSYTDDVIKVFCTDLYKRNANSQTVIGTHYCVELKNGTKVLDMIVNCSGKIKLKVFREGIWEDYLYVKGLIVEQKLNEKYDIPQKLELANK